MVRVHPGQPPSFHFSMWVQHSALPLHLTTVLYLLHHLCLRLAELRRVASSVQIDFTCVADVA